METGQSLGLGGPHYRHLFPHRHSPGGRPLQTHAAVSASPVTVRSLLPPAANFDTTYTHRELRDYLRDHRDLCVYHTYVLWLGFKKQLWTANRRIQHMLSYSAQREWNLRSLSLEVLIYICIHYRAGKFAVCQGHSATALPSITRGKTNFTECLLSRTRQTFTSTKFALGKKK